MYAGTKIAIMNAYNAYKTTLNEFFSSSNGILWWREFPPAICDDQEVLSFSACNNPHLFSTVYETYKNKEMSHYYQLLHLFGNVSYHRERLWEVNK